MAERQITIHDDDHRHVTLHGCDVEIKVIDDGFRIEVRHLDERKPPVVYSFIGKATHNPRT